MERPVTFIMRIFHFLDFSWTNNPQKTQHKTNKCETWIIFFPKHPWWMIHIRILATVLSSNIQSKDPFEVWMLVDARSKSTAVIH